MTILEQLGELVAEGEPEPGERERIRLHMIDSIAAWVAASEAEEGSRILSFGRRGRKPAFPGESSLDEITRRVAITRSSEIDDIHMPSCVTPGAVVVQTALALAKDCAATPETVMAAIWAGYEIVTRLGMAVQGARILYRGVWPTYLLAPVAAAAVVARLLRLDPLGCANALSIAVSMASGGVGAPADHLVRFLQAGLAARAGATAALAASEGVGADTTLLNGDWFTRVHGIEFDAAFIKPSEGLGATRQLSIKPWCAAKQTIAAIDGFRQILARGRAAAEISDVRVMVPPSYAKMIGHHDCAHRVGRITSVACQLALAALAPDRLTEVKRTDLSTDPDMAAFMRRVSVAPAEELMEHFPQTWPARLEVRFVDGAVDTVLVTQAQGDPGRPLTPADIDAKFRALAVPVLGSDKSSRLLGFCKAAFDSGPELHVLLDALDSLALRLRRTHPGAADLDGNALSEDRLFGYEGSGVKS